MNNINVRCTNCSLNENVSEGTTKSKFYRDGIDGIRFLLRAERKTLYNLASIVVSTEIYEKAKELPAGFSPARETKTPVVKVQKLKSGRIESCRDGLIPPRLLSNQSCAPLPDLS